MRHTHVLVIVLTAALGGAARTQDPTAGPKGSPPEFAAVRFGVAEGTVEVVRTTAVAQARTVTEMKPVTKVVVVNGKQVEMVELVPVTRQVMAQVPVSQAATYPVKDVRVYDLKGKRLGAKELRQLILQKGTAAVLVAPDARIDPCYAQCLREGTLVLVLPPLRQPPPGAEAPRK